ncbi:MAG TPA: cupin domain-containing protein [archaeon]|nr:cupin domain-containing protein [archaeon]
MLTAGEIIKKYGLSPLPEEGGYYRETYRSEGKIPKAALPERYGSAKSFCTAIYYLLTPETCSVMHRISSDEIFHFYLGDPVLMLKLHPDRTSEVVRLGRRIDKGHEVQVVVPGGTWQGCFLEAGGSFALLGTTVSPGFDFSDYEGGDREALIKKYPDREELIKRLTQPFLLNS